MTDILASTFFRVEREGAVAHLILNRPEKANGMSPDFWKDLPRLVKALEADVTLRTLVLSGEGKHFSGGMDLASFHGVMKLMQGEPARAAYALRELILELQASLSSLEQVRFPVIAAVHGACLGAGVDLITACDIRLAAGDAKFGIEEIHLGMTADAGTLQRLPHLIAPGIVRELAYTGRRFSAQEALGWGLCNQVHADRDATVAAAMAMAHEIAAKAPIAIAGAKKAITVARDMPVAQALDQIATWNAGMLRQEDLMAAMQAKMQKQEAIFSDLMENIA